MWDVYIYLHSTFECEAKLGETTVNVIKGHFTLARLCATEI